MSKGKLSYLYWLDRTFFGSCPKINFLQDLNLNTYHFYILQSARVNQRRFIPSHFTKVECQSINLPLKHFSTENWVGNQKKKKEEKNHYTIYILLTYLSIERNHLLHSQNMLKRPKSSKIGISHVNWLKSMLLNRKLLQANLMSRDILH